MAAVLAVSMCGMPAWADTKASASQGASAGASAGADASADPVISLSLGNGYLVYGAGQIVRPPATKVTAAAGRDFKFVPEADKGYKVASVSYAGLDLYPNSVGEYVIPASQLAPGARLVLVTEKEGAASGSSASGTTTLSSQTSVPSESQTAAVSEAITQSGEITQQFAVGTLVDDSEGSSSAGTTSAKPQVVDNGAVDVEKGGVLKLGSDRGAFAHVWTTSDEGVALVAGDRSVAVVNGMDAGTVVITHTYAEYLEGGTKWQTRSEKWTVSVAEPQKPADAEEGLQGDDAGELGTAAEHGTAAEPPAPDVTDDPAGADPAGSNVSGAAAPAAGADEPAASDAPAQPAAPSDGPDAASATFAERIEVTADDANGNGIPDAQEFTATVTMGDWTYGDSPHNPKASVIVTQLAGDSVSSGDFGDANIAYRPQGGDEMSWSDTRPVDAGAYEVRAVWHHSVFGEVAAKTSFSILKRPVTLTSATEERAYDGTELRNGEVIVGGSNWAAGEGASFDVTGSIVNVGSVSNDFTYTLSANTKADNYDITLVVGTLTVTKVAADEPTLVVYAASATKAYDGTPLTAGFSFEDGRLAEGDWLDVQTEGTQTNAGTSENKIVSLSVKNAAGDDVTSNYNVAASEVPGTLTVAPRKVTLTSASAYKPYDGEALTNGEVTVGGRGWVEGQGATISVTGSQTEVGTSANAFTYTLDAGTDAGNYDVATTFGTLTVGNADAEHEVTLRVKGGSFTYDGTPKEVGGFESLTFEIEGETYTVEGMTAHLSAVDAGEYVVSATGVPVVKTADGDDVSRLFNVKTEPGTLSIAPRNVLLVSGSAAKAYDGQPLASKDVQVMGEGWGFGDGASYNVTGSQTKVGSSPNAFTYTLSATTKADNYVISQQEGTLTVTPADAEHAVVLVPNTATFAYDGTEHAVEGFHVKGSTGVSFKVDGRTYTVSGVSVGAKGTDAGSYAVEVSETPVVKNATGADVSGQFAVTVERGDVLEITPRNVTLTSDSLVKPYDGTPLQNANPMPAVGGDGWANGSEGATYSFTGSQTLVGSSENVFTYALNANTKAGNYRITTAYGTLQVVNRDAKYQVTVAGASEARTYDGTEQALTGLAGEQVYTLGSGGDAKEVKAVQVGAEGRPYYVTGLEARGTGKDVVAGGYPVNVTGAAVVYDPDGNDVTEQFAVTSIPGTLTIEKRPLTLKSADLKKDYDGTLLVNGDTKLAIEEGWADGEGAVYAFGGSVLYPGTADNAFTITYNEGTNPDNYALSKTAGILEVVNPGKQALEVFGNSATVTYDGQEHEVSGFVGQGENGDITVQWGDGGPTYTVRGLEPGAWQAKGTNVPSNQDGTVSVEGTLSYDGSAVHVYDEKGTPVDEYLTVRAVPGKLVINPRPVTFTSATADKPYDGTPLTSDVVEISGEGLADGEAVDFTVTGSQTLVGTSENTFAYAPKDGAGFVDSNYAVTLVRGQLTVTPADAEFAVELTRGSDVLTYDGALHEGPGFEGERGTVSVPAKDDQPAHVVEGIKATAKNGVTYLVNTDGYVMDAPVRNAGVHSLGATGAPAVFDENGNDVTEQVAVIVRPGTLTIERRPVTLLSNTDAKVYDDEALTGTSVVAVNDAENEGWADGEEGSFLFTSSQTSVGSVDNRFECVSNASANMGNYAVTIQTGTLSVVPQSINPDDPTEINPDDLMQAVYTGATVEAPEAPTYNGQPQELVPVVRAANGRALRLGSEFSMSYTGNTTSVGTVSAIATASRAGNFRGAASCEYEILPAPARIIVNPAAKFFGDDDPRDYASYAVEGLFGSDTLGTVTLSRIGDDEAVGTYEGVIDATVAQQNGNYVVTGVERGSFTIAPIEGNALLLQNVAGSDGFTKTYDGHPAVIQARALQPGSQIWFSADGTLDNWTTDLPDFVNAGTYQVYVQATHGNFEPTDPVLATVTISPAVATVAVDSAAKVAGEADPEFTGTVTGLVAGDKLENLAYSRLGDDEAVGTYPDTLTASYYPNPNYSVRVVPGTFTITAPPLTVAPVGGGATPGVAPDDGPIATVAGLLAAPFEAFIEGDETPLTEAIDDDGVPEAAFDHPVCWVHFYVFLGIALTLAYGAACVFLRLRGTRGIADLENDLTAGGRSRGTARSSAPAADEARG